MHVYPHDHSTVPSLTLSSRRIMSDGTSQSSSWTSTGTRHNGAAAEPQPVVPRCQRKVLLTLKMIWKRKAALPVSQSVKRPEPPL